MDVDAVKNKINEMSAAAYNMLTKTYDGFMQHNRDKLSEVLRAEGNLNELEKAINTSLALGSRAQELQQKDKDALIALANIAADFEEIGDYIKDMVERIEIKIQEKLLFSETAVGEYTHLYEAVRADFNQIVNALKMSDHRFASKLFCDEGHVGELVEKYHQSHAERLLRGQCTPLACNMYLNLLDLTAEIHNRIKRIAAALQRIK